MRTLSENKPVIAREVIAYAQRLGITPEEAAQRLRSMFGTDDPEIIRWKVIRFFAMVGGVIGFIIGYFVAGFLGSLIGIACGGIGLGGIIMIMGKILNRV